MPKACNPVRLILRFASSCNSLSLSIQISLPSGPERTKGVRGEVGRGEVWRPIEREDRDKDRSLVKSAFLDKIKGVRVTALLLKISTCVPRGPTMLCRGRGSSHPWCSEWFLRNENYPTSRNPCATNPITKKSVCCVGPWAWLSIYVSNNGEKSVNGPTFVRSQHR